jgi:hypothetical protein
VNVVDTPDKPNDDPSKIIGYIKLYHYVIGLSEETLCQGSYTPRKALFPFSVGALAYNLFHTLYLIISNAEEEQENYWVKLNKQMLTYFWKEFKDDGKHKSRCIGELALLIVRVFGRMLLTLGLNHTKKCSNYLVCHTMLKKKR